jgi:hypothetical protein
VSCSDEAAAGRGRDAAKSETQTQPVVNGRKILTVRSLFKIKILPRIAKSIERNEKTI